MSGKKHGFPENPLLWGIAVLAALGGGCDSRGRTDGSTGDGGRGEAGRSTGGLREIVIEAKDDQGGAPRRIPIQVELAVTREETQRGFMHRNSIPRGQGMLFLWGKVREEQRMTMRNCKVPLSVAFLDPNGRIVQILDMNVGPDPSEGHVCRIPNSYALEMNQGWFEENEVVVGDRLEIPEDIREMNEKWVR